MLLKIVAAFALANSVVASNLQGYEVKPLTQSKHGKHPVKANQTNTVEYQVEQEEGEEDAFALPQIDSVFSNPLLVANLERGADAINRSIESLMDALFYSLLDNELIFSTNEFTWISLNLSRRVFTTARGSYVVVDRFSYGPQMLKPISKVFDIPVRLGSRSGVDVLDIYLRTDAQRLAEREEVSWPRYLANTWLGTLPVLARLLPPSFNANELYDPVRQIEEVFHFPISKERFEMMQIGSVRSYAITGGVSLPIDLASKVGGTFQDIISQSGGKIQAPYGIFIDGEFRINVLRRTATTAWVGLTRKKETGHSFNPIIGGTYFILQNALVSVPWTGLLTPITPVEVALKNSIQSVFNQLYEFDVSSPEGEHAFVKATKGDFTEASQLAKNKKSVIFHFNRSEDAVLATQSYRNGFFALQDSRNKSAKKSEIKVWDNDKTSYMLEAEGIIAEESWNLLTGKESVDLTSTLEMNVNKQTSSQTGETIYSFIEGDPNPYQLRFGLQIKDRYADASDYREYLHMMRTFSGLPLSTLPDIPLKNTSEVLEAAQLDFYAEPDESVFYLHTADQEVGRFDTQSVVLISKQALEKVLLLERAKLWQILLALFNTRYEFDKIYPIYADPLLLDKALSLVRLPTHIVAKYKLWDVPLQDISKIIEDLDQLREARTPMEIQDACYELFDTDHPDKILQLFYKALPSRKIPRRTKVFIKPSGKLPPEIAQKLTKANKFSFSSTKDLPPRNKHRIAKDKLNAFVPGTLAELRSRPVVEHLALSKKLYNRFDSDGHIFVEILSHGMKDIESAKIYVRLEQAGKLMLGKYVLGQDVIRLPPLEPPKSIKTNLDQTYFSFFLTGPKSPLADFVYNRAINLGGEFLLSISISRDGNIWSREKTFRFLFDHGKLEMPRE